jgi:hypothetical protein
MLDANLFYEALASDLGVVIETPDNVEKVRQRLYVIRRELAEFSCVSIVVGADPEKPQEIWLIRNDTGIQNTTPEASS